MARFMKKIMMLLMAFIMLLSCMTMPVAAAKTMDDFFPNGNITLASPLFVYNGDETGGLIEMCVTTPQEMTEIGSYYGPSFDNIFGTDGMCLMGTQIDYRVNGGAWHYTAEWDKLNQTNMENSIVQYHLNMNELFGPQPSYRVSILSSSVETEDYGDVSALFKANGEDVYLDIENNTIEFRARAYVYYKLTSGEEKYVFSNWSQELKPGETPSQDEKHFFESPEIAFVDINPSPNAMNFSIKVNITENIMNEWTQFKAIYGQASDFDLEAKIMPVAEDGSFKEDEAIELISLSKNAPSHEGFHLEETLRYDFSYDSSFDRYDKWAISVRFVGKDQFESEYSEPKLVSTVATNDPNQDEEGNLITDDLVTDEKCPVCGFCPMPLGICVFAYVLIGVVLLVIATVAIFIIRKKRNESYY